MKSKYLILILSLFFLSCSDNGDKFIGKWNRIDGGGELEIQKFGPDYKVTGCNSCPFQATYKNGELNMNFVPGKIDSKNGHLYWDGKEYERVK